MSGAVVGRPLTISLVSRDNGVGLTVDMGLLESVLGGAGHTVHRVDWSQPSMHRCDVAIFLELWNPRLARYAAHTVGVFNLEWFQSGWVRDLPRITQLWAKSAEAYAVYQRRQLRKATLTGFLSRDLNDPGVERTLSCVHLRGKSDFKNTQAVLEAWLADPTLPPLTVISRTPMDVPSHVRVIGPLTHEELRHELNKATIHVCPSQAEGWGHYITEALSVRGLVVTTDASPMNEHVRPEWGTLLRPSRVGRRGMVSEYGVSPESIVDAVRHLASLPADTRAQMSKRAREHFDHRNAQFTATALSLLARI